MLKRNAKQMSVFREKDVTNGGVEVVICASFEYGAEITFLRKSVFWQCEALPGCGDCIEIDGMDIDVKVRHWRADRVELYSSRLVAPDAERYQTLIALLIEHRGWEKVDPIIE